MNCIPVVNKERTGEKLKNLRKKNKLTMRNLADRMGFETIQAIYKWEHGINLPTVDNLIILSTIFGVLIEEILHVDMVRI